ncbi:MAG: hypothetical protein WD315_06450 [Balneolaceae bacterium]
MFAGPDRVAHIRFTRRSVGILFYWLRRGIRHRPKEIVKAGDVLPISVSVRICPEKMSSEFSSARRR